MDRNYKTDRTIPELLRVALYSFQRGARRPGRTWRILAQLRDGDVDVAPTAHVADYARRSFRSMYPGNPPDVRYIVCKPTIDELASRLSGGRYPNLIFDHTWLEQFYERAIFDAFPELDAVTKAFSLEGVENGRANLEEGNVPVFREDDT